MLLNLSEVVDKRSHLSRPYKGKVVDNNDPLKLGRVKCSIEGLLDGIGNEELPWIAQSAPAFLGGVSGTGILAVPEIGSDLKIEFPYEDIYSGEYTGYWPSKTNAINDPEEYPNKVGFIIGGFKLTFVKPDGIFTLEHPNGSKIEISKEGDMTVDSKANVNIISAQEIKMNVEGMGGDVLTKITDPVVDLITGVPTIGVINVKAGMG